MWTPRRGWGTPDSLMVGLAVGIRPSPSLAGVSVPALVKPGGPDLRFLMAPDILADPETDPTATYAVEPALVRRLTARVVCARGRSTA